MLKLTVDPNIENFNFNHLLNFLGERVTSFEKGDTSLLKDRKQALSNVWRFGSHRILRRHNLTDHYDVCTAVCVSLLTDLQREGIKLNINLEDLIYKINLHDDVEIPLIDLGTHLKDIMSGDHKARFKALELRTVPVLVGVYGEQMGSSERYEESLKECLKKESIVTQFLSLANKVSAFFWEVGLEVFQGNSSMMDDGVISNYKGGLMKLSRNLPLLKDQGVFDIEHPLLSETSLSDSVNMMTSYINGTSSSNVSLGFEYCSRAIEEYCGPDRLKELVSKSRSVDRLQAFRIGFNK